MSKIQEQIKALQLKQKKIEYLSYIADLIKNDTKCVDFKDVQKEVVEKIEPFILQLMESIEKDSPIFSEKVELFDANEVKVLKLIAAKAQEKKSEAPPQAAPQNLNQFSQEVPPPQPPQQKTKQQEMRELSNNDKMNFALNHRHLANKEVTVLNAQNAPIETGVVVGLDAPDVLVKTKTGPTIKVPVDKVVIA